MRRSVVFVLMWALLVAAVPGMVYAQATPEAGTQSFVLSGTLETTGEVTLADLLELPSQTADVTFRAGDSEERHSYEGVLLLDLITARGLVVDESAHNDKLAKYVVATGSDGYEAIVAYGEIDPQFGNQPVLVAYAEDGVALDRARLVVPGDGRGGRYVSNIVAIEVRDVDSKPRT